MSTASALRPLRTMFAAPGAKVAAGVIATVTLVAIFAGVIAPYHPNELAGMTTAKNLAPSVAHWCGTDPSSRDVLSRVLFGARVSLGVGAASVLVAMTLGTAWGALAGFAGGWTDTIMMRTVDAVLAIPRLLLLLVVASTGTLSIGGLILLLGLTGWPAMSRVVRAQMRTLRAREFVLAARAAGIPSYRLLTRHLLPGILPQVIVAATLAFAAVIPLEAGLSFLGLGVRTPTPSWGNIILEGSDNPAGTWWMILFPALAIIVTVAAVNVIGERLREVADPRQLPPR